MRCREMMSGASGARSRMLSGLSCPLCRWVSGPAERGSFHLTQGAPRGSGSGESGAFRFTGFFLFSHGARRSPPAQSLPA